MSFTATLTGSYPPVKFPPPPLDESKIEESIRRAIAHQMSAIRNKKVDWLFVSGQPQSDIAGIFASSSGLTGEQLPYLVTQEIKHTHPITLRELEIAAEAAAGYPLKAHVSDPTLLVESCELTDQAPARYREDPRFPRELTLDFARAMATEAHILTHATHLNVKYLQIDASTLAFGANLDLAREGIELITHSVAPGVQTILHACGDVSAIIQELLNMPVDILNLEYQHLRDMMDLTGEKLFASRKRLALGCIPVNADDTPSERQLERELLFAMERFGVQNIWGITPNCGLRLNTLDNAQLRVERLAEVAERISSQFMQEGWPQ